MTVNTSLFELEKYTQHMPQPGCLDVLDGAPVGEGEPHDVVMYGEGEPQTGSRAT